ncbi:hypothetical protein ASE08_07215 [Rhizobacter sp. Root16D2]|nr:hypothetical protein ASE08_07215 [Rhizobacter sp. Root16D2]
MGSASPHAPDLLMTMGRRLRVLMAAWLLADAAHAAGVVALSPPKNVVSIADLEAVVSVSEQPPPDTADWRPVRLPDRWAENGRARAGTVWYRLRVHIDPGQRDLWAFEVAYATMNSDLWVNGMLVGRAGRMEPGNLTRHWNTPLLFTVPSSAWTATDNLVYLRVRCGTSSDGGLGHLFAGPADELSKVHEQRVFWRTGLLTVADAYIFALGVLFAIIWLRRREALQYGYFAAATLLWAVCTSNDLLSDPPLSQHAWQVLIFVCNIWTALLFALFFLRFAGRVLPRLERGAIGFVLVANAVQILVNPDWQQIAFAVAILGVLLLCGWATVVLLSDAQGRSRRDRLLLGIAAAIGMVVGAHDWLLTIFVLPFDGTHLVAYAAPLVLSISAWVIAGDYTRAQEDLARLNRQLADRVRQREVELRASFAHLAEADRDFAVATERALVLRDLHDAVGTRLAIAMRQLEEERAAPLTVAQTLRETLDRLKLLIDALTMPPGDVNALLASLRYRLQRRIEAAGLDLRWEVDRLPHWEAGEHGDTMRRLQRLLLEAISNTLRHSQATELHLAASATDGGIRVALTNNGRGLDDVPVAGLRTMHEHAVGLGAVLEIGSTDLGGSIRLMLPPTR